MSSVGHGMFSYIPDSSMIGTVFCNFIANAMYAHSIHDFYHCIMSNTMCRCVAYSVIDVQLELQGATWNHRYHDAGQPHAITFSVAGLQVHSSAAASPVTRLTFSLVTHQYGQPKHFLFSKLPSGSFSIRAIAIVHGKSAACFNCTDPQPEFPLLTEQRALVSYMHAMCKCRSCSLPLSPHSRRLCHHHPAVSYFTHTRYVITDTPCRSYSASP